MSAARKTLYPIVHEDLYEAYKRAEACFWRMEEVDLSKDYDDFQLKLNNDQRHFIMHVLGFFSAADSIVNINVLNYMLQTVPELEAVYFYTFQAAMENVHTQMYGTLIIELIPDKKQQDLILNAFDNVPCVRKKDDWAMKWIENDKATLAERLVAFAIVEGVFFSGSFAAIFYIKTLGIMPGLTFSNELISRDEGMHTDFACLYYNTRVQEKLSYETILDMFKEAVNIEKEFFTDALPVALLGMNANMMCEYIEFVADRLLLQLGQPKYYNARNPFPFMNNISLEGKTNFFERRVGEYKMFGTGSDKFEILNEF
ncbi:RR2B [Mythimna sequax nucleopolyhedrovirus]|nr:RR2B [Mythimna sequax nucleopolyhedrovirus]